MATQPAPILAATRGPLAAHWWVPLLRGIIALIFGIVLFVLPLSSVAAFVLLFGAYAAVDGVLGIVQALRFAHPSTGRWWLQLLAGVCGILVGIITLVYPAITALTLAWFISAWAIVTGFFEIGAGFRLRKDVPGEIFMICAGLFSVVLGVAIFFFPLGGLLAAVWVIATYGIIAGFALIGLAFRLRGLAKTPA